MAKKEVKNKIPSKKYAHYTISGNTIKRKATCPKCGPGVFLANHKDRVVCGNCGYMEKSKKE